MLKINHHMWLHCTPGDHGLKKLKSTQPEDALTQDTAYLADYILRIF